jgi:hypothetical protein
MGSTEDRERFVNQVRKGCRIAQRLRELGARPDGVVRIDSASSVEEWSKDPKANTRRIAETFRAACDVAADYGERLAAEGEICWGGMHSWRKMVELLELVERPKIIGFQADMAHTLLYVMGYNAPEDAILPPDWDWSDPARLDQALQTLTKALRPWTIDFHVAQNDATVKGSGTHDKTGHHCLPTDPNGKLQIARHARHWFRDENGQPTKAFRHICWDGCMFSNETMMQQQTWNDILSAMIAVRDAHGWSDNGTPIEELEKLTVQVRAPRKRVARKLKKPAAKPAKSRSGKAAPTRARTTGRKPAGRKAAARKPAARKATVPKRQKAASKSKASKKATGKSKARINLRRNRR